MRNNKVISSVCEAIGGTPLVELSRIIKGVDGKILAKLEYLNPGLSKKDRIARQIIEDAERYGALKPGQPVVELTSGNTGTGLAMVCGLTGHPFIAVMSKGNTRERARMMKALGAEVVVVDQLPESQPGKVSGGDLEQVEQKAQEITRERNAFRADQFNHSGSFRAHYLHTGPEMLEQSNHTINAFCDFAGTGGSFAGCAAAFKEAGASIKCYLVEPAGCAVLAGKPMVNPNHVIQGGGYSIPHLSLVRPEHVDGYLQVTDEEAIVTARRLAAEEFIFAGFSSGANVAAALQLLRGPCRGQVVAVLINDSGLKYLSTDLYPE